MNISKLFNTKVVSGICTINSAAFLGLGTLISTSSSPMQAAPILFTALGWGALALMTKSIEKEVRSQRNDENAARARIQGLLRERVDSYKTSFERVGKPRATNKPASGPSL